MGARADKLLNAAVAQVRDSGLAHETIRMGTVTAVSSFGTVSVQRNDDVFPVVRLLGSYAPAVGDRVEIANTMGGWICLGPLRISSSPKIQSGNVSVDTVSSDNWVYVTVTFPEPFETTPVVVATPNASLSSAQIYCSVRNITTTSVEIGVMRPSDYPSEACWIATTF